MGRPSKLTDAQKAEARRRRDAGCDPCRTRAQLRRRQEHDFAANGMLLRRYWKFASFVVAVLALVFWFVGTSEAFKHCINERKTGDAYKALYESPSVIIRAIKRLDLNRVCAGDFSDKNNGAITALSTVLLTLVTGGLVWIGHQQIATSRAQLRAYVFVSMGVVTNVVHGTGMPEAQVTIRNSGQTPAHDVIALSGFAIDRYPPPATLNLIISDAEFSAPARTREVLGPGGSSISVIPAGRMLTAPEKASFASGTGIIYVYGEIRYRDAFGRRHWTKYRFMMGGPVGVRGGQLTACEEGNEAT